MWWWIFRIGRDYDLTPEDVPKDVPSGVRWLDVWATRDPIPDGPLPSDRAVSRAVTNRASALTDHGNYHTNPYVVLPLLAGIHSDVAEALRRAPLPIDVRSTWWTLQHLVAIAAAGSLTVTWLREGIGANLLGVALAVVPLVVWSRLELLWRLRRRDQLTAGAGSRAYGRSSTNSRPGVSPDGPRPFAWWIGDSEQNGSYARLALPMTAAVLAVAMLQTDPPATLELGTRLGISAGFGSPNALAVVACYAAVAASYLVARFVASLGWPSSRLPV